MEPVVSPWLIYFIVIIDKVRVSLIFFSSVALFFSIFALLSFLEDEIEKDIDVINKNIKRSFWVVVFSFIILFSSMSFIPNQKGIIAIVTAKLITYDVVENVEKKTKNVVDYIFEQIEKKQDE